MAQEQAANKMMAYLKKMAIGTSRLSSELIALLISSYMKNIQDGLLDIKMLKGGDMTHKDLSALRSKGEKVYQIEIPSDEIEDFERILKSNKTLYMCTKLNKKYDEVNPTLDNEQDIVETYQITYIENQREKVEASSDLLQAIYGYSNQIKLETFGIYYDGLTTTIIEGMTDKEFEIFKDHAETQGLIYSPKREENGTYTIYYGPDQGNNAERAAFALGLDLTSPKADELLERAQRSIDNRNILNKSFTDKIGTIYLVNTINPNTCIKVTDLDYTFYKNGTPISSLNRDEKKFKDELKSYIPELDNYVVLTESEYNMEEREKIIKEKDNIYPEGFYDEFNFEKQTYEHRQAAIGYFDRYNVNKFVPNRNDSELGRIISSAQTKKEKYKRENDNSRKERGFTGKEY